MSAGLLTAAFLVGAAAFVYNCQMNTLVQSCCPDQPKPLWLWRGFALVNAAVLAGLIFWDLALFFLYAIFAGLLAAEYALLFRRGAASASLLACGYGPFLLLCLHGVLIPAFALARGENMHAVAQNPLLFDFTLLCAFLLCSAAHALFARRMSGGWIAPLLACAEQRRLVCGCLYLLFGYLVLEGYVYTDSYPGQWLPWFHLITSVIALAVFLMLLRYAVGISAYIEYELKTRQVEKQLQRQVVHYQQYTRYVRDLRAFKHDFRHMVETAHSLLRAGEADKAGALLGQMRDEVEVSLHSAQYANHVVVDAILQECAGRCREAGIAFTAAVSLPERLGLGELELCRIFGNLADNAYEACAAETGPDRFIALESRTSGGWLTVQVRNSFHGTITLRDGLPVTQKHDPTRHGLGLSSVRQLVERTGGFLQIETAPGSFTVRLHFCVPPA